MKREIGVCLLCIFLSSCTPAVKKAVLPKSTDRVEVVQRGSFNFSEEEERFIVSEARKLNIPIPDREEIKRYMAYFLRNKPYFERTLERAKEYLPIIKPIIEESGLPVELAYLPVIESAFNPYAVSKAGAAGLWQFIPSTARRYGLRVDGVVDERFDVIKSTYAAVRYLKDLYHMFGNWELALAGYNCGENCVKSKTAGADFWITKDRLPTETRNYVPAFFAVLLILRDPVKYGLSPSYALLEVMSKKEEKVTPQKVIRVEYPKVSPRERILTLENEAKLVIIE